MLESISFDGEIWKEIKGFENIYAISNFGRLASTLSGKWKLRKLTNSKKDYFRVNLIYNGKNKTILIHRIVAEHFLVRNDGCNEVHHKDGNKQNNKVSNLEWIDKKTHAKKHYEKNKKMCEAMNNYNKYIKPKIIHQFNKNGEYIQSFPNAADASRKTGVCQRNILQVASGDEYKPGRKRFSAGGYVWSFERNIFN